MKRILVILVAILAVSSLAFAGAEERYGAWAFNIITNSDGVVMPMALNETPAGWLMVKCERPPSELYLKLHSTSFLGGRNGSAENYIRRKFVYRFDDGPPVETMWAYFGNEAHLW